MYISIMDQSGEPAGRENLRAKWVPAAEWQRNLPGLLTLIFAQQYHPIIDNFIPSRYVEGRANLRKGAPQQRSEGVRDCARIL
jgi:hypothetical protein